MDLKTFQKRLTKSEKNVKQLQSFIACQRRPQEEEICHQILFPADRKILQQAGKKAEQSLH